MKTRNSSIDILKFLAVLLITHSHMEILYGEYAFLCTGGAIGDALFFFISGFTLSMGGEVRFDNWYKRRINRIYPTVFAWALLSCAIFNRDCDFLYIIKYGGGRFVTWIMVFYVILYPVKKYCIKYLSHLVCILIAIIVAYFFIISDNQKEMYANNNDLWPMWCFAMMLFGSILGLKSSITEMVNTLNPYKEFGKCVCCVIVYYALCIMALKFNMSAITIAALPPLFGIVYYLYRFCNCTALLSLYNHKLVHYIIYWGGSLCLEVYLVQGYVFTDKLNGLFPLNILVNWIAVFVAAYILKVCSNFFSQTFKDQNYDWKKMLTL